MNRADRVGIDLRKMPRDATRWGTALLATFAAASSAFAQAELEVSYDVALVDERIGIAVHGLDPNQPFALRAITLDQRDREWIAEAHFRADEQGRVDLSKLAPLPGSSYEHADAMGLFWSAEPTVDGAQIGHGPGIEYVTRIALVVGAEMMDEDTIARRFDRPDLIREDVASDEVVGTYYRPAGDGPFAGVVVFAGSDGGVESAAWRAALLASRGFAALAVAVFRYEGRPADLVEIPIEDASAAVSWLANRPETGRVGVLGFSKGSELALSVAARNPSVHAVVAISLSAYVWPGITDGPPETRSSWTWRGEPLPSIPWSVGERAGAMFGAGPPYRLRVLYEESLAAATPEIRSAAEVPVVDILAPVLLVSGDEDGSWPASDMADLLVARMTAAGRAHDVEHLRYPGSGHMIFWDYLPASAAERNREQIFGGTTAATAAARADSWPRIQRFLTEALRPADGSALTPAGLEFPYRTEPACPGEGCAYGTWLSCGTVSLHAEPDAARSLDARLAPLETFEVETGAVIVRTPEVIVVTRPTRRIVSLENSETFAPGDTLYVLDYLGEGFFNAWFEGTITEVEVFWPWEPFHPADGYRYAGRVVQAGESEFWVRGTGRGGSSGWMWVDRANVAAANALDPAPLECY